MHVWDINSRVMVCNIDMLLTVYLCICCCQASVETLSAMQAYATLAAEPHPGSVKCFSWVLPQMSTLTIHLWPELNGTLRQETVSK